MQDDATVKCWGYNGAGALGQGDTFNKGDDANGLCPPSSITASFKLALRFLLLVPDLSTCRDGSEPPVDRAGGWEDGRSRQRWEPTHVRAAGKTIHWEIGGGDR